MTRPEIYAALKNFCDARRKAELELAQLNEWIDILSRQLNGEDGSIAARDFVGIAAECPAQDEIPVSSSTSLALRPSILQVMAGFPGQSGSIGQITESLIGIGWKTGDADRTRPIRSAIKDMCRQGKIVRVAAGVYKISLDSSSPMMGRRQSRQPRDLTPSRPSRLTGEGPSISLRELVLRILGEDPLKIWSRREVTARLAEIGWSTTSDRPADVVSATMGTLYKKDVIDRPMDGHYRLRLATLQPMEARIPA